ncbi:SEC-C metal-binding domain-containing protein [Breznakiellaceae bacterium SP9]
MSIDRQTKDPSKISRNVLCPCGSGKKYKRCCLGKSNTSSQLKKGLEPYTQEALIKLTGEIFSMVPPVNTPAAFFLGWVPCGTLHECRVKAFMLFQRGK